MVRVHPKPRDYLFVAGQRRRTLIVETEAKVRTAIGAGRSPETRNITDIARETGMTSQSVLSCRTRKKRKGNKPGEKSANVTRDDSFDDALVVIAGCAETNDEWVLDTACTFHMCPHRDWFNNFDSTTSTGSVLCYDNSPCKIEGIGSIQIKMFDGIIRTLIDV